MTMQFLASVRRNKKQWMVVLTILAIFAFLFDDVVRGASNLTTNSTALIFAVLCAGLMSIIGYPRGQTTTYGLIGFAAGGAAALIGASFAGSKPFVRTNVGNLTQNRIVELQNRRMKVNYFLRNAMQSVSPEAPAPNFGDVSESSMVAYSVLQHEAKRLGVSISDDAVEKYIKESVRIPVSQFNPKEKKLTREGYETALKESEVSEATLFDMIRDELAVQLVGRLLSPPANVHPWMGAWTGGQMSGRVPFMTPEQRWENFRKLHVKQQLSAVAIPVSEFEKLVPEPKDSDIKEYFDKRKSLFDDDRGNPGFMEPAKVKLAYLAVPFSEKYEKGLSGATDQEIVDYYLEHKERDYRIFDIPEGTAPKLPDNIDLEIPADAAAPENTLPALDSIPSLDSETLPVVKPKDPAAEKSDKEEKQPAKDEKKSEEPAKPESPCGDEEKPAKESQEAAKDEEKPKQNEKAKPEDKGDKEKEPEFELPKPAAGADDETPPPPALPMDDIDLPKPSIPKPKYRDLDDDLKLEIREKILLEKAFAKMGDVRFSAFQFMMEQALNYDRTAKTDAAKKKRDEIAATFAKKLKEYAEQHGLEYHETRELTHRELVNLNIEPIGSATKAAGDDANRRDQQNVADIVFGFDSTGRRISLYDPQTADSPKVRYAYWKTAEIPAKVPELKNDANDPLRQRVITEWKKEKARGLAEKRAQDLVGLAKTSPTDLATALSGQTINNTKESPAVKVIETPKFSWLRTSQSVPSMGLGMPMESFIDGIMQPGPEFMKLIFDQLGEGEVGYGLNRPRDTFYVVRVHNRDAAGEDGGVAQQDLHQKFMRETFTTADAQQIWMGSPTPYDYLGAMGVQGPLESRWRQDFNKRFGIKFEQPMDSEDSDE